jgi:nucleoside-diphosphate-sugar epimerase
MNKTITNIYKSQNIVITGAAGFIGSTLANLFDELGYYNLTLIDSLEFGDKNNLSKKLQEKLNITNCLDYNELYILIPPGAIVFHFAGISSLPECESNTLAAINNNFLSTVYIAEVGFKRKIKRLVFASTSAVYENNNEQFFEECLTINPDLFYSFSKHLSEQHLNVLSKKDISFDIVICRFFNVYGYKQDINRLNPPFTGYLINALLNKKKAIIYNSNPNVKRDYIYVDDLINGLITLIDFNISSKYKCINFTSGYSYSVEEILEIFKIESGGIFEYEFGVPTDIWSRYPNLLNFVGKERIEKEVFKNSRGTSFELKKLLGTDYEFTTIQKGISKILQNFKFQ